jgi:hypothetical protein
MCYENNRKLSDSNPDVAEWAIGGFIVGGVTMMALMAIKK